MDHNMEEDDPLDMIELELDPPPLPSSAASGPTTSVISVSSTSPQPSTNRTESNHQFASATNSKASSVRTTRSTTPSSLQASAIPTVPTRSKISRNSPLRSIESVVQSNGIDKPFTTCYVYDERMLMHKEMDRFSDDHPEAPARISATFEKLKAEGLIARMKKIPVKEVGWEEVSLVHTRKLWEEVEGFAQFTEDDVFRTLDLYKAVSLYVVPETSLCARISCGGVIETALTVMDPMNSVRNAFAVVRPPGHHSEPQTPSGFCFFNNVAVAARVVQEKYGKIRTVIIDWDVHHGNGTQRAFYTDDSILYVSLHRYDNGSFYPGSPEGGMEWCGEGKGEGLNVNIPWNGIMGDSDYVIAFERVVMPILREFVPEIIFVSAGFDAARGDPLGGFDVTPAGYASILSLLCTLANGKVVVALEGGYNPPTVAECAAACTQTLLGDPPPMLSKLQPSISAEQTLYEVAKVQSKYWRLLVPGHKPPKDSFEGMTGSISELPEIISSHRREWLSEKYGMVPLPLSQTQLAKVYDGLVHTTMNVFRSIDTLVLFVHDIGNLSVEDSGPMGNVELPSSYLIDCSNEIINWSLDQSALGLGQGGECGVIDISLPLQYPISLKYGLAYSSPKVAKQSYKSLLQHVWDHVVEIGQAKNVVMIGHGVGCTALTSLISSSAVESRTKAVVQVYGMNEVLKIVDDPQKKTWYAESSYRLAPQSHPFFELTRKAANRIGKVNRSDESEPVMVLHRALGEIRSFVGERLHPSQSRDGYT